MYWSFGFSNSPSSGYSGLISFRIDWFDPLAVQGTLKSLLQHHSSKASILWCSAFFMVQLTSIQDYQENQSFVRRTFVGKVACLCFNSLSRFVCFFSKEQASFNFKAALTVHGDFGVQENKICYYYHWQKINKIEIKKKYNRPRTDSLKEYTKLTNLWPGSPRRESKSKENKK